MDATAELAIEQHYFDHAKDVRETKRETRQNAPKAAGDNKAAGRLKANFEADRTLGSPSDAAALVRIDLKSGGPVYAGLHSILDEQSNALVCEWQLPYVMSLREATPTNPGDVVRQRSFRTDGNTIKSFEDLILAHIAAMVSKLDNAELVALKEDSLLVEALGRNRSPEMQQIVQTIQAAQSQLIRRDLDTLTIIQGGPGTGKTAVALHRISWLLYTYHDAGLKPEDILVVGPNRTFTQYIRQVLPDLGDDHVVQADLVSMLQANVSVGLKDEEAVARLKGDDRMVALISRALNERVRQPTDEANFAVTGVPWKVRLTPEAIESLIDEARAETYAVGRTRFRETTMANLSTQVHRHIKNDGNITKVDPRTLLRTAEIDLFVERVWPQLSPQAFLRDLFGSLERLVLAAGSDFSADEVRLLRRQAAPKLANELWSKEDLVLLDAANADINGDPDSFRHIVVDEAQDLSPMQLLALRRRSETGSMTIVGDIAQSTGHWSRNSWDDVRDSLLSALPHEIVNLEHGYRVPKSVMALAARLLPIAAPGIVPPTVLREVTPGPQVHSVADDGDLAHDVVAAVKNHASKGRFIGVVCPDGRRAELGAALKVEEIDWNDADAGKLSKAINVVNPVAAKGLEFDAVIVVDPQMIVDAGPEGYRMLYIAMTRTTHYLDIVHPAGSFPRILADGDAPGSPADSGSEKPTDLDLELAALVTSTSGAVDAPSAVVTPAIGVPSPGTTTRVPTDRTHSARDRTITFHAEGIVDLLRETVPEHLWAEVLELVRTRSAEEE